jgi:hypothetical protein
MHDIQDSLSPLQREETAMQNRIIIPRPAAALMLAGTLAVAAPAELLIGVSGTAGRYLAPDEVRGNITGHPGSGEYRSSYAADEGGSAEGGYDQSSYRYSHPFHEDARNNIGFALDIAYLFPSGMGFGFEFQRTFSVGEHAAAHTVRDTLGQDVYSSIPHDTKVRSATSDDRLYLKSRLVGMAWHYRRRLGGKLSLTLRCALGLANHIQLFQVEQTDVRTDYLQSNGHAVYSEPGQPSFDVFGIRYAAAYLRPAVGVHYHLVPRLSLRGEVGIPVSYVEKGYRWREGEGAGWFDAAAYYPRERFAIGNLHLSLGMLAHVGPLGKGGSR